MVANGYISVDKRTENPVFWAFLFCAIDNSMLYIESIVTKCCTSQFCLLPESITASGQINLTESSRCGVLPKTYSYSVLCLATICSPSFLIIRG